MHRGRAHNRAMTAASAGRRRVSPHHLCGSSNSALRRPYTFIVAALLLLIVSPLVILRPPTAIVRTLTSPSLASCGNTARGITRGTTGQAEANLWSFHGRFQNGFECLRETYSGDSPRAVRFRRT